MPPYGSVHYRLPGAWLVHRRLFTPGGSCKTNNNCIKIGSREPVCWLNAVGGDERDTVYADPRNGYNIFRDEAVLVHQILELGNIAAFIEACLRSVGVLMVRTLADHAAHGIAIAGNHHEITPVNIDRCSNSCGGFPIVTLTVSDQWMEVECTAWPS